MKKQIYLIFIIVLSLSLIANVSAFFPYTHDRGTIDAVNQVKTGNLYQSCLDNIDNCRAGNILTDFSVVYYYTSFKKYAITHSSAFCSQTINNANTDQELACAVGNCLHQTQDYISHHSAVPYCIESTYLPNILIHPFCEQGIDDYVYNKFPQYTNDQIPVEAFDPCKDLFKRTLEGNTEYSSVNLDSVMDKLISEIGTTKTGYDLSFNNLTAIPFTLVFVYVMFMIFLWFIIILTIFMMIKKKRIKFINILIIVLFGIPAILLFVLFMANLGGKAFTTFTFIVKPISDALPQFEAKPVIYNQIVTDSVTLLTEGESFLFGKDASGGSALYQADTRIRTPQFILGIIIVIISLLLTILNFRSFNKK